MAEIVQMNENTWRIEDGGVRFFVLTGERSALMIDSGMNCPEARSLAEQITKLPLKLLNTHTDRDHISGNEAFSEFYMSPAEWEWYHGHEEHPGTLLPVSEGSEIDLGGRKLRIFDLPGHTDGSIAVLDADARVLYGGDSVQDGNIFMFGQRRDLDAYIESLRILWERHAAEFDRVYPCHGSIPVEKSIIPGLIEGAESVRDGKAPGLPTDIHGKTVVLYKTANAGFLREK